MSFFYVLSIVFPICAYMFTGYGVQKWMELSGQSLKQMNMLVYKVFLPLMVFKNIYQSELKSQMNTGLLLYAVIAVLFLFALVRFVLSRVESNKRKLSVMIQGIYRSNYVLFGIPIAEMIYGSANIGIAVLIAAAVVPIFNILAVYIFESYGIEGTNRKKLLKGIATNPIIVSTVIGLLFLLTGIKLPEVLLETVSKLAAMAAPLGLFILGALFKFNNLKKNIKRLVLVVSLRLIFVPALFVGIAILLGFRGIDLMTATILFASPAAVASYSMAEQMGGDGELAGQILFLTSIFSSITIFLWLYILGAFRLI